MKNTHPALYVALIVIGAIFLVRNTGILHLSVGDILWMLVAIIGGVKLYRGFTLPDQHRAKIFWGTVLLLLGGAVVLDRLGVVEVPGALEGPLLFFIPAAGFLLVIARSPRDWHLVVPFLACTAIGGCLLMVELGFLSPWEFRILTEQYAAYGLVLFGAAILLRGYLLARVKSTAAQA